MYIACNPIEVAFTMTAKQIEHGFWHRDDQNNFPPESIRFPHQYSGQPYLNIACSQLLDLSPTQQKKLVKEWIDFLPTCKKVEMLWFSTHLSQPLFESACKLTSLTGLNIKWSSITSLDQIVNLCQLKFLRIGSSAKLKSISALAKLANLEVLSMENLSKITDFSLLSALINLRFLSIEGGMYTTQKVDSFEPFSKLTNLVYFSSAMVRCADKRIDPLLQLKNLVTLNWSFEISAKDMERLQKALPNLKYLPNRYFEENMKKIKQLTG